MDEQFRRQRRNFMLISIALFLIHYLELEFNHVNILGNTADIENSAGIESLLWLMFVYWSVRYTQHLIILQVPFQTYFTQRLNLYLRRSYSYTKTTSPEIPKLLQKRIENGELPESTPPHNDIDWVSLSDSVRFKTIPLKMIFQLHYQLYVNELTKQRVTNHETSYFESLTLYVRALAHLSFNTTLFSEYLFPYLLATITLSYALVDAFT